MPECAGWRLMVWSVIDSKVHIQPRVISHPMARIHRGLRGITFGDIASIGKADIDVTDGLT